MPFHYIVPSHSTALFLGFVAFNIISYSLLIAELVLIWFGQEHLHFYKHIFNGSYAVLMFIGKYYFPSVCTLESGIDVGQRINVGLFLSKSFLGFVAFNIISYSLLIAELVLIWFGQEHLHFYKHIFNGSYAVLMFICKYYFPSFLPLYDVSQWVQK